MKKYTNVLINNDEVEIINGIPMLNEKNRSNEAGIGWGLMSVSLIFLFFFFFIPLLLNFYLSFTRYDFFTVPEFIGLKNYVLLFSQDKIFIISLLNSLLQTFSMTKIFFIIIFPLFTAFLMTNFKKAVERIIRIIFTLLIYFASIYFISFIMRNLFLSREVFKNFNFARYEYIYNFVIDLTEITFGLTISLTVGYSIYFAFFKSEFELFEAGMSNMSLWTKILKIFLISFLLYFFYSLTAFDSVYFSTGGGPNNSTLSLMLYYFRKSYEFMDIGSSSAIFMLMTVILSVTGILFFLMIKKANIKIWFTDIEEKYNINKGSAYTVVLIFSIIFFIITLLFLIIFFILPVLFFFIKSFPLKNYFEGLRFSQGFSFIYSLIITVIIYGIIIFIQFIISFITGFALGRFRFFGRNFLLLIITISVFITPVFISQGFYLIMRMFHLVNTYLPVIFSYIFSPLIILLFTFFFDGTRIDSARLKLENDFNIQNRIKNKMIFDMICMSFFILIIQSVFIYNDFVISLIYINSPKLYTLNTALRFFSDPMIGTNKEIIYAMTYFSLLPRSVIMIIFIILQLLFLPRMRILIFNKKQSG